MRWRTVAGLVGLMGTSAIVRLIPAWEYGSHPLGQYPWVDEASYWTWARVIAGGQWLPTRPFYQDPLYPYALSVLIRAVGDDVARLRIASAVLGVFTPLITAWAGFVGLGRAEGWLAGAFLAFYGPLVLSDLSLEKEGFAAALSALGLACVASSASSTNRGAWSTISGFIWGALGLLRSNALVVAPVGAAWLSIIGGWKSSRRWRWREPGLFLIGFGLALTPALAANLAVSAPREFLGTTWQLGPNFYIGNNPEATGTYAAPLFVRANPGYEAADFAAEASRRAGRRLSPGEVSRYWLGQGLASWSESPVGSARRLAWKFALLLHGEEVPDSQDAEFLQAVAVPGLALGFLGFGVLLPLAVIGLPRASGSPFGRFLIASTGVGLGSTALFFVVGRYRVPWSPGLALLAAAGTFDLFLLARTRDWPRLARRAWLLGLPAVAFAWWPIEDPVPGRWGRHLFTLGLAELRSGQLGPAIDDLDLARAVGPESARFVDGAVSRPPMLDLMTRLVDSELRDAEGLSSTARRARLDRQRPGGSARARALIDRRIEEGYDDPALFRERGLAWLTLPARELDRLNALRDLGRASQGGDPRAALLLALMAHDPRVLGSPAVGPALQTHPRTTLVRKILDRLPPPIR